MDKIDISDDKFDFMTEENFVNTTLVVPFANMTPAMKDLYHQKTKFAAQPEFVVAGATTSARNVAERFGAIKYGFVSDVDNDVEVTVFFV